MMFQRHSPTGTLRKSLLRARLSREEGQGLVEFTIALGIFFALTIGILVVCMGVFTYEYVNFAAREAVRWAAVRGSECYLSSHTMPGCSSSSGASKTDIQQYVVGLNYPLINPKTLSANGYSNINVAWLYNTKHGSPPTAYASWVACPPSAGLLQGQACNDPGDAVQVSVSYPFTQGVYIPFVGSFTPIVSSTSQIVISQ